MLTEARARLPSLGILQLWRKIDWVPSRFSGLWALFSS
jgi:hypothetical protein